MKKLVLITDNYPPSDGAFFLTTEVRHLSRYFEQIHILVQASPGKTDIPENVKIHVQPMRIGWWKKVAALRRCVAKPIQDEQRHMRKFDPALTSSEVIKSACLDWMKSSVIISHLRQLMISENLDSRQTLFYAYWHDYKALALARLHAEGSIEHAIARAHGWDVFRERHQPPYLPFKAFILQHLDATVSISETGKEALQKYLSPDQKANIEVFRLGTERSGDPHKNDGGDIFRICSCSSMIPLKRIGSIMDMLKEIHDREIRWVHFGAGVEMNALVEKSKELPANVQVDFPGAVNNEYILEYYAKNPVDLFVSMSASEGIPVSMMEAMSFGIPVMATDVGGVKEIVNQKNGRLLPVDISIEKAAEALRSFIDLPESQKIEMRSQAEQTWEKQYKAEENYRNFAEFIQGLASHS